MAKGKKATQAETPSGRPRAEIDLRQVEELAGIQCTHEEIAAVIGVSRATVTDRLANDPEFLAAYEKGRDEGKASLRRVQWRLALRGHPTMLVWLGKQYLQQRDKFEHTGAEGGPIRTAHEVNPKDLPDDLLRQLYERLTEVRARELADGAGADGSAAPN